MLPRYLTLVLICISSSFLKVQDREKFIPIPNTKNYLSAFNEAPIILDTIPCLCSTSPQIVPLAAGTNSRMYGGLPNAACTPFHTHPGAAEFKNGVDSVDSCGVSNVAYFWSIAIGNNIASINGSNTSNTVNVVLSGSGNFTVRLETTVTCNNGTTCSNFNYYNDSVPVPKSCSCEVDVDCQRGADQGGLRTYSGVLKGGCTGEYGPSAPYLPCGIKNVAWSWQITEGANVIEIVGPANQQTVHVNVKGSGRYELRVQADVECSDGTKACGSFNFDYCRDSVSTGKKCDINVEEKVEPIMDGGLQPKYNGLKKIARDEFILLGADGKDYDQVKFSCIPSVGCNETGSNKTVVLNSRVKFEWSVTGGEGSFVKLGALPQDSKSDVGNHVIFKPPFVPLPQKANDTSKTTTVQLLVIDDNPTQPIDPVVTRNITITTKRFKNAPDEYQVTVQSPAFTLPGIPSVGGQTGTCNAVGPVWQLKTDLKKPEIEIPDVPDKDKMVVGEWMVLNAKDQRDGDELRIVCRSATCDSTPYKNIYQDNVEWEWTVIGGNTNGKIISDLKGRYVVYEAPDKLPDKKDMIEVKVRVKVKNPDAMKAMDDVPPDGEITLKVFRAGVKLEFPAPNWIPQDNNNASLKSFLVYRDGNVWKPALAHQFRIHFFELLNVSTEKGNSLNEPLPSKDECRDLYFNNGQAHEAFNDKGNCKIKELFLEARTKNPEREFTIPVQSRDFGAYGFLKSEAAKGNKPNYESIPVVWADVPHPVRGVMNRKQENDNRVSIPRDVDENHIADGGWAATGGVQVADPAANDVDEDGTPTGDGFAGDGLTTYEEYRGFHTIIGGAVTHVRINPANKNLFVRNRDALPMNLFSQQSGLTVHEVNADQYINDGTRWINFNFNPKTHKTNQLGLLLINAGNHNTLLGIALGAGGQPAPPNWVTEVRVYNDRVIAFANRRGLNAAQKTAQVTAHELAHACNVYHHGEGNPEIEGSFNAIHGLRSGNMSCIMRYDNVVVGQVEAIGTIFCNSPAGTGTNANNMGFRDANVTLCRGNCLGQFRVSGREQKYPQRVNNKCQRGQ